MCLNIYGADCSNIMNNSKKKIQVKIFFLKRVIPVKAVVHAALGAVILGGPAVTGSGFVAWERLYIDINVWKGGKTGLVIDEPHTTYEMQDAHVGKL